MFNDVSKKRMPQLFTARIQTKLLKNKDQFKSWWRQLTQKSNKPSSSASSHTTLDWRSLSPDRPPLPFFLPESPTSSTTSIDTTNRSIIKPASYPTNTTPIDNNTTLDIEPKRYNNTKNTTNNNTSNNNKPTHRNTTENYQPLCPILEESETMITESTGSNIVVTNNNSAINRSSPQISENGSDESLHNTNEPPIATSSKPVLTEDKPEVASSSTSSSSQQPWPEIKAIQNTPSDRYMPQDLVGNEDRCKRKFAKMVLAASKYQTEQKQEERPSHMALLFDVHGNIDMMRMVRQGKSEYHKFCGNSQYVPPELSTNVEYQSELADIWVLGIFLYRMLVGKYPFSAPNDQQLFKKMLHSDFSIPNELSDDAKDIIRRMLAPDSTRASLDLIIYHPWIKVYRPLLLDQHKNKDTSSRPPTTTTTTTATTTTTTTTTTKKQRNISMKSIRRSNSVNTAPDPSSSSIAHEAPKPKKTKYNKRGPRFIKKAILLIFQGPFPPPKKPYRDLAHLGTRESVFAKQQQG